MLERIVEELTAPVLWSSVDLASNLAKRSFLAQSVGKRRPVLVLSTGGETVVESVPTARRCPLTEIAHSSSFRIPRSGL